MKITLTPEESETYFHNALCNGLGYIQNYGVYLDYYKQEYEQAKAKLALLSNPPKLLSIINVLLVIVYVFELEL